jgi:signal transduction histidine kinase
MAELAHQVAAGCRERYPHLSWVVANCGTAEVSADPRRAAQVGELLTANAGEAAQSRVVIQTAAHKQAGAVEWTVTDDGPGVLPEHADLLFTPFFTTKAGHSGLGLALAKKLVVLHGGRITAGNAAPGTGFQVRVVFPLDPPGA